MKTRARADDSIRAKPTATRVAIVVTFALLSSGCLSSGYRAAAKDTPPPQLFDAAFVTDRLEAKLVTVITYNGPGSWKRNAFWDEYVVTLHNPGSEPLTIGTVGLTDSEGTIRRAGSAPWTLERESKTLEQKYRSAGIAFVRYTAPGVLILTGGAAAIAATGVFSAVAATAALATVVTLPMYYASVLVINHSNKAAMEKEFARRRLVEPLTLPPGEVRTGSYFFPMVAGPRSLSFQWSDSAQRGEAAVELGFLRNLHIATPAQPASRQD